jgi:hypothetical protein
MVCHSTCKDYLDEQAARRAKNEKVRKIKIQDWAYGMVRKGKHNKLKKAIDERSRGRKNK